MKDLRQSNVDFLTIGQYLQPTKDHAEIKKYYTPEEFDEFRKIAYDFGFKHVESGPLVRSSYHAQRAFC
jgi:lipoic acid synthetase